MYMGWRLKLEIIPHATSCKACLCLLKRQAPRWVFLHGASLSRIYQRRYQSYVRKWRKSHVDESESSAKNFRLLSGNHRGRQVSTEYLPGIVLPYTKVGFV